VHIGFFGMRNAGKSSLVNAVTGQSLSVVSEVKGTTTDPVKKAMELLPLGPVVIIDTPGFDDEGYLGEKRVEKTNEILARTDVAVLVVDSLKGLSDGDKELIEAFNKRNIPYIIAFNKCELLTEKAALNDNEIYVSAVKNENIFELKEKIGGLAKTTEKKKYVVSDLVEKGDIVVLVIPIDEAAPKGRLILPQQMTIRDLLDANCSVIACQDTELSETLNALARKPKLVITDSQIFGKVSKIVPDDILLTSFSILMARYKGFLDTAVNGAAAIDSLKDGDKILISEGCTHHRQCGDIGSVKLPNMLKKYTGKNFEIVLTSGRDFPEDLTEYALVIHCGGCMLNEKEVAYRRKLAEMQGVPFTNYGTALAKFSGILERSIEPVKN
jgi:[FeFe] hydrogenase H-cluster maturation GTPase HydF